MKSNNLKKNPQAGHCQEDCYPYQPGSTIKVDFYPEPGLPPLSVDAQEGCPSPTDVREHRQPPISLSLKVIQTLSKTLSCVLLVGLADGQNLLNESTTVAPGARTLILKLCDRRFSEGLREEYKASKWTLKIEKDFQKFQALPEKDRPEVSIDPQNDSWCYGDDDEWQGGVVASVSSANGRVEPKKRISQDKWTPGHREMYLQKISDRLFKTEIAVYRQLGEVHGKKVPSIYGTVRLREAKAPTARGRGLVGANINGILMEYIHPSFSLRNIPENITDRKLWQNVGRTAVKLVQDIGDLGIVNRDVRLDNILLAPVEEGFYDSNEDDNIEDMEFEGSRTLKFFRAFMIDFGLARVQAEDESDDEFRKDRLQQDEEGAIGFVLEKHLMDAVSKEGPLETRRENRPFKFQHSQRLRSSWDDDEYDAGI